MFRYFFFFSSRRRHTRFDCDWSSDVCSSDLIQGNLDPVALLAPRPELERQGRDVLARAGGRPGHIFNLGHGVLPETPVEALQAGGGWGGGGWGGRPAGVWGMRGRGVWPGGSR